jgi:membrane-associated phospholipid phosphatase
MKKTVLFFLAAAIILLAAGTFFDLPLDEKLYDPESGFAEFFATAGMFPQTILTIIAPAMILAALYVRRKNLPLVSFIVIAALLICFESYFSHDTIKYVLEKPFGYYGAIAVLCAMIGAFFFAALPFARKKPREMFFVALAGIAAMCAGYIVLHYAKLYWGRHRFYKMDNPALQFTPWYLPQGKGDGNDFQSFPSGHSFAAMLAVWFSLWPRFIDPLKRFTKALFAITILFGLATMFSRIVYGRHFLSDVTMGASLSLGAMMLALFLFDKYSDRIYRFIFSKGTLNA